MKNSDVLQKAKEVVDSKLTVDGEFMSCKEIVQLKKVSEALSYMRLVELGNEKRQEIKAFMDHMDASFPDADATADEMDDFYCSMFTIGFRGKTIEIVNGADIFQGIYDVLKVQYEDY